MSVSLGMSGSRDGMSDEAKRTLKKLLKEYEVKEAHHGDCVGADTRFHAIMKKKGIRVVVHPPKNSKMRSFCEGDEVRKPLDYIERNHQIVDESDILVSFPSTKHEVLRSGTWATIRYARKRGKKVIIIHQDGSIDEM